MMNEMGFRNYSSPPKEGNPDLLIDFSQILDLGRLVERNVAFVKSMGGRC